MGVEACGGIAEVQRVFRHAGRVPGCVTASAKGVGMRERTRGFSVVELLVVVSLVAAGFGALMPAVGKAREAAGRVRCASQLRGIGQAAYAYAADHGGRFPMGYVTRPVSGRAAFPAFVAGNSEGVSTEFEVWQRYGVGERQWVCPGAGYESGRWGGTAMWGPIVGVGYVYVGGLTDRAGRAGFVGEGGRIGWGDRVPAEGIADRGASRRVLGADVVMWAPPASTWTGWVHLAPNHPRRDLRSVEFGNVLYGDGRVEGQGRGYWPKMLGAENSAYRFGAPPMDVHFYW